MGVLVIAAIFAIVIGFTSSVYTVRDQPKSEINIAVPGPGPGYIRAYINPLSEIKKTHLIKQSYDFSCGSAALAILLNFYLGENFTEKQVIQGLIRYGDIEQITKRQAFSLLDMKKFVKVLGYQGDGYKVDIEDLKTLNTPCIIPIKIFDYRHFVVFRGIYKGHIFLADPWRGDISFTLDEFYDKWYKKVIFVVSTKETEKVLTLLQLKESDLNFIDEDAVRQIIVDHTNPAATAAAEREFKQIIDAPGEIQYYRGRK